jgi:hypothetical protein
MAFMRVPNGRIHQNEIRFTFALIIGMVIGAILMMLYFGKELTDLYTQIKTLEYENSSLAEKIAIKEKELSSWNSRSKVNDVIIHIDNAPSEVVHTEIHRMALRDTYFLIGKDIRSVEETFESLFRIFSPKIYVVSEKRYEIRLKALAMGTRVHLYLTVKEVE